MSLQASQLGKFWRSRKLHQVAQKEIGDNISKERAEKMSLMSVNVLTAQRAEAGVVVY